MLDPTAEVRCQNCGTLAPAGAAYCSACGAALEIPRAPLTREEGLRELVESSNEKLNKAGAGAAESAFGLSCSLGVLAGGLLLGIVLFAGLRNWIIVAGIIFIVMLITTFVATILAGKARSASIEGAYRREVSPAIDKYLRREEFTRPDFDTAAADLLLSDDPLRGYIQPPAHVNEEETKE